MKNFCIAVWNKIKKHKVKILIIFIVYLLFSSAINFFVNPYNIFPLQKISAISIKPMAKKHLIKSKFISLKLDSRKINTVFIGSQKADFAIDTNEYKNITGLDAVNLASSGYSVKDYPAVLKSALKIHPEIKNVFVNLDFATFDKKTNSKSKTFKVVKNGYLTLPEIYISLFSLTGVRESVYTLFVNAIGKKSGMFDYNGMALVTSDENIKQTMEKSVAEYTEIYEKFQYDKDLIKVVEELQRICAEEEKELYIFIMPSHLMNMQLMKKQGIYDNYFEWKDEISKIIPIFDFEYPCSVTNEAISPTMKYFSGITMPTTIAGQLVLDSMTNGKIEFGRIYTYDYAEIFNNSDRSELGMLTVDEDGRNEFLEKTVQQAEDDEDSSQ